MNTFTRPRPLANNTVKLCLPAFVYGYIEQMAMQQGHIVTHWLPHLYCHTHKPLKAET